MVQKNDVPLIQRCSIEVRPCCNDVMKRWGNDAGLVKVKKIMLLPLFVDVFGKFSQPTQTKLCPYCILDTLVAS